MPRRERDGGGRRGLSFWRIVRIKGGGDSVLCAHHTLFQMFLTHVLKKELSSGLKSDRLLPIYIDRDEDDIQQQVCQGR